MATFPSEITKNYTEIEKIGEGGYGVVYKVKKRASLNNESYAMKVISKAFSAEKDVKTEISILRDLKNPYLIHLENLIESEGEIFIITEFCQNLDLMHRLKSVHTPLDETEIWKYFIQVCLGLECMHVNGFIHRDIKLENILLDKENNIKIADFGISRFEHGSTSKGTPLYFSPELAQKHPASKSSDIWALGCVLYCLCQRRYPFGEDKEAPYCPINNCYSESLRKFVGWCLEKTSHDRPTISDILTHPKIIGESLSLGINIPQESILFQSILKQTLKLTGLGFSFDEFTVQIKPSKSHEIELPQEFIKIKSKIIKKNESHINHSVANSDHFSEKIKIEESSEIGSQCWSSRKDESHKQLENELLDFNSDLKSSSDIINSKNYNEFQDFESLQIQKEEIKETFSYEIKNQITKPFEDLSSSYETNEILFVKPNTSTVFSLSLQSLQTKEICILQNNILGYGSIWIPELQSTLFYGGTKSVYCNSFLKATFLIDKNSNIKYLADGKPACWVGLVHCKNYVYAIGGWITPVSEKYNYIDNKWESCAPLLANDNFTCSSCVAFQDHILMVSYNFQKIKIYDVSNDGYLDDFALEPPLSGSYKMIFCYIDRLYIAEGARFLYQSGVNDFKSWEQIGNCEIENFGPVSHSMRYLDKIYTYQYVSKLVEFNLKEKRLCYASLK